MRHKYTTYGTNNQDNNNNNNKKQIPIKSTHLKKYTKPGTTKIEWPDPPFDYTVDKPVRYQPWYNVPDAKRPKRIGCPHKHIGRLPSDLFDPSSDEEEELEEEDPIPDFLSYRQLDLIDTWERFAEVLAASGYHTIAECSIWEARTDHDSLEYDWRHSESVKVEKVPECELHLDTLDTQ